MLRITVIAKAFDLVLHCASVLRKCFTSFWLQKSKFANINNINYYNFPKIQILYLSRRISLIRSADFGNLFLSLKENVSPLWNTPNTLPMTHTGVHGGIKTLTTDKIERYHLAAWHRNWTNGVFCRENTQV